MRSPKTAPKQVAYGYVASDSRTDGKINGLSFYSSFNKGFDVVPIAEIGYALVTYQLNGNYDNNPKSYVLENTILFQQLTQDILTGSNSPHIYRDSLLGNPASRSLDFLKPMNREKAATEALRYAWIYQNIEFGSGE